MALPIRSINPKKAGHGRSDPLDGLASRLHGVLAEEDGQRLAKARLAIWIRTLLDILFPQAAEQTFATVGEVRDALDASAAELRSLLRPLEGQIEDPAEIAAAFFQSLPEIHRQLMIDATAIERGDPAAESVDEVILAYPGFLAIAVYRMAHRFSELGVPILPRVLTEWAHERTGIDIHPGATLGHPVVIDHGTGIVVGETAVIGNNVKLYQGVTLGALSVTKSLASTKRHPTIENDVVIYANATILGGETVIGRGSVIGGNVWITASIPPDSIVYQRSEVHVRQGRADFEAPDFVI
ncbi:MAG TPA: serine O-acetyltransferase EpsC [Candidatus Limnocylindrales bacterium]|jgi:serine O-acetyltransferase